MMHVFWLGIKLAVSLLLVAVAIWQFWSTKSGLSESNILVVASMLIFLAAVPWISRDGASRPLGLASIFISFAGFYKAHNIITGQILFPRSCAGHRSYSCEIENFLFSFGGEFLAATLALSIALLLLAGGVAMMIRQ